jgi:hypothetical protein
MKFTYTGGSAWIGIGISSQGKTKMTPANAIIGRANGDGSTFVLKYSLTSDAEDASGVNSKASQTLTDVSFVQNGATSTLTFTQLLNDPDLEVSDQSTWIYAVGLPRNQWTGEHNIYGSFQIALQSCLVVPDTPSPTDANKAPTTSPSVAPTGAPTTVPSVAPTWAPVVHSPTTSPGLTTLAAPSGKCCDRH